MQLPLPALHPRFEKRKRFARSIDGSFHVWKERPLKEVLIEYAALDVVVLHAIKRAWMRYSPTASNKLIADWRRPPAVHGPPRGGRWRFGIGNRRVGSVYNDALQRHAWHFSITLPPQWHFHLKRGDLNRSRRKSRE